MKKPKVIVVGGGLAGLAASVRIAESGVPVDLFSMVPVKRSHSVCAQGGINACNKVARQQGYSEWQHMDETLYGGDFLNHQPPVHSMAHWAPKIINLLDRMGVPFNRTPEGERDLRMFGGSPVKRTHFAGATTGQQLMYALDEQARRWEAEGSVTKYEFWEFLAPVLDDNGHAKGIIAQDMRTMQIRAFKADAVVMATGGNGLVFGKSTNSVICTGGAAVRCYKKGAWFGNAEMIQVHPTAIPGEDKCRLMSESARGEGGRVWVPRQKNDTRHPNQISEDERWYFLEEKYPKYGNLVPRDIATRELFWKCQEGYGIGGGRMVYLDCTHLPDATKNKLAGIFEIYEKFTGDDPREVAMKIFPAVHYSMGGLYTVYTAQQDNHGMELGAPNNMQTNIPGLYAFGEVNYAYHGGTRLGANALLSCIFDGLFCGLSVANYVNDENTASCDDVPDKLYEAEEKAQQDLVQKLVDSDGKHNPYHIHQKLGDIMTDKCTVIREDAGLKEAMGVVSELREQYKDLKLSDTGMWTNQNLSFARALDDMLIYAQVILKGSLLREESRGSHYRPDFPERDDSRFLKTTVAKYDGDGEPVIEFEDVPQPLVEPRARTYGSVEAKKEKEEPGGEGYSQRPAEESPHYSGEKGLAANKEGE